MVIETEQMSDKEVNKLIKEENKYFRYLIRSSIRKQKLSLTKGDILYKFVEDFTQLKFDKAFVTFLRLFCIFAGIVDIILMDYLIGIIIIVMNIVTIIFDFYHFVYKLKRDKFEEDLDNNLKKIEKQLLIRGYIKFLNTIAKDDDINFDINDITEINKDFNYANKDN